MSEDGDELIESFYKAKEKAYEEQQKELASISDEDLRKEMERRNPPPEEDDDSKSSYIDDDDDDGSIGWTRSPRYSDNDTWFPSDD
jgi:hypothetical protein